MGKFLWWGEDDKKKIDFKLITKECKPIDFVIEPFAFFLAGGGANGRDQAGRLIALAQKGVFEQCKFIAGTSIGGLNTGVFCKFGSVIKDAAPEIPQPWMTAKEIWEGIKTNADVYKGGMGSIFDNIRLAAGFTFGAKAILDRTPTRKLLQGIFGDITLEELAKINNTHIVITTMDLNTQKAVFFSSFDPELKHYKVWEVLMATSGIPGVFEATPIKMPDENIHWFVDGGVAANNPFLTMTAYNKAFPNKPIKKAIVVFCYPDDFTDIGISIEAPKKQKSFEKFRDALIGTIPAMMNGQEQMAEITIEAAVNKLDYDILALYPDKVLGDALDFGNEKLLQHGYDETVEGKGYSYKDKAEINIIDFLKR